MNPEQKRTQAAGRLLQLIDLLASGAGHSTEQLATTLNVARRTINRDIKLLTTAGFDVIRDEQTGLVRLGRETFLPPIDLTADEALTIAVIGGLLADRTGIPGLSHFATLTDKIIAALPRPLLSRCESLAKACRINLPSHSQPDRTGAWYRLFHDALVRHRVVETHYDGIFDGQAIVTCIEPAFLVFRRRAWYCIGHSSHHKEVRTFHLGRVILGQLSKQTYVPDPSLTPETYFADAWAFIRGDTHHKVRIWFSPKVARNVADVRWHHTQDIHWQRDDSIIATFEVDGLDEIHWWILGYGDQAKVLEPPELQTMLKTHAQSMLALYTP